MVRICRLPDSIASRKIAGGEACCLTLPMQTHTVAALSGVMMF
jgi:hypothetical protein